MYNSGCWRLFSDYLRCFLAFDCTLSEVKLTIYFQSTKQTCSGVANGSLLFFLSPVTLYNIVTQGEKINIWGKFFCCSTRSGLGGINLGKGLGKVFACNSRKSQRITWQNKAGRIGGGCSHETEEFLLFLDLQLKYSRFSAVFFIYD